MASAASAGSEPATAAEPKQRKAKLVYPGLIIPFWLLVLCFAAWGSAANLTDVLVGVFRSIFDMSNFQSALVQFAYYGAYFSLAIPAAFINRRFGYKTGVLTGLGLASIGGLLFIPASSLLAFAPFLVALFVLAAGLSILETLGQPVRDRDGARGERDAAAQPGPGLQPGRREHRRPARRRAHPARDHVRGGEDDHVARRAARGPGGRPVARARALPRHRGRARDHLAADRVPQDADAIRAGPGGGGHAPRGVRAPVAEPPLPLRGRRPVLQRRRTGVRLELHHPVRPGRRRRLARPRGLLPPGEPDPVPHQPVRHGLPAGDRQADPAVVQPWPRSAWSCA